MIRQELVRLTASVNQKVIPLTHGSGPREIARLVTTTDTAPRVLHGYVREHPFMTPRETAILRARLADFAVQGGYQLGKIYTEKLETSPEAFRSLVQAVLDDKAVAIAVPSLHHLSGLSHPIGTRPEFERATGARVLVAETP